MSMKNGGPVFPRDHAHDGHNGMTLRDYFATKAMQGLLATDLKPNVENEDLAEVAYAIADAMLREREVIR